MKQSAIVYLLFAISLIGCRSTRDEDNRPVAADAKHLSISVPAGSLHFTVPSGWHIRTQPFPAYRTSFAYSLTRNGTFREPFLDICLNSAGQTNSTTREGLHDTYISMLRFNFQKTAQKRGGSVLLQSGEMVKCYEYYYENPGYGAHYELVAFLPRREFTVRVSLLSYNADGLDHERRAFESVLRSCALE